MIDFSNNDIVVRMREGFEFGLKILDALVGPINLCPTSIEWR
jgi:hypothetical protein